MKVVGHEFDNSVTVRLDDQSLNLLEGLSSRLQMSPDSFLSELIYQVSSMCFSKNELFLLFGKKVVIGTVLWEES